MNPNTNQHNNSQQGNMLPNSQPSQTPPQQAYVNLPTPQNAYNAPAPQLKKYWQKNLMLLGIALFYLLPIFIIQDAAMIGPIMYFMFVVGPALVIGFLFFNINTYLYNRRVKRGLALPSEQKKSQSLAIALIVSILSMITIALLIYFLPALDLLVGILLYLLTLLGFMPTILAIFLLVSCIQQKHFSTLSIAALSLYGFFMVGGYILFEFIL